MVDPGELETLAQAGIASLSLGSTAQTNDTIAGNTINATGAFTRTDGTTGTIADGAMGKPVWLLLGYVAHWLWLTERADSPWYPSVRLFRPRAQGDWNDVFDSASVELMKLAKF